MKATGIVRRMDDLGRAVISKEIRRTMCIRDGAGKIHHRPGPGNPRARPPARSGQEKSNIKTENYWNKKETQERKRKCENVGSKIWRNSEQTGRRKISFGKEMWYKCEELDCGKGHFSEIVQYAQKWNVKKRKTSTIAINIIFFIIITNKLYACLIFLLYFFIYYKHTIAKWKKTILIFYCYFISI